LLIAFVAGGYVQRLPRLPLPHGGGAAARVTRVPRANLARLVARRGTRHAVALAAYALSTAAWFAPVLRRPTTGVLGGLNDGTSLIRDLWAMDAVGATPFDWGRDVLVSAPEGIPRPPALAYQSALHQLAVWLPGEAVGWTLAFNMYVLASFVLAGFLTFLLLDRLQCGFLAALFGGYVFAFSPERVWIAFAGHAGRAQNWILPLTALCLLNARQTRSARWAVAAGATIATAAFFDAYLGLFALVLALVFLAVDAILARRRVHVLRRSAIVFAAAFVPLLVPLAVWQANPAQVSGALGRSPRDIELFDARLTEYLLPSERHPVFGSSVRTYFERHPEARNFDENTLFVGYATLALAGVGLVGLVTSRRRRLTDAQRYGALAATALVVTAFVMSRVYLVDLGGFRMPGPAFFLEQITVAYRAFARFGVLVGLGLVILASIGLGRLVRRRWPTIVVFALVVFELAPGPPLQLFRTDDRSPEIEWLDRHPGGIVANYPLYEAYGLPDGTPIATMRARAAFFQIRHGHPLFDGAKLDGTRAHELRIIASDLTNPSTPEVLAARGVRFIVVHDDVYRSLGQRPLVLDPSEFELQARFEGLRIFALRTERAPQVAVALRESRGFYSPEGTWRWMRGSGVVTVLSPTPGRLRIAFRARSNGRPTRVLLLGLGDAVLGAERVGMETSSVSFDSVVVSRGENVFRLVAEGPPAPISPGDRREATVFVSPIEASRDAEWRRARPFGMGTP
jgi:hypothetical protein